MKTELLTAFFLLSFRVATAQTGPASDDSTTHKSPVTFSAYADLYYLYDFNRPVDHERPVFVYSHSRHNEIMLNNAVVSAAYQKDRVRGNVAFHAGSYVQRNYAAEELNGSEVLKFIYQANAGVRLAKGFWLDAGIIPSHIGYESALSLDNPTLTRSMMADNTPYYEMGAKLTWDVSDQLTVSGLVLNGWQRIVETDDDKALGTHIQWKPAKGVLLNSSTFVGREVTRRYFHNFYAVLEPSRKFMLVTAFDIGWQQQKDAQGNETGYLNWWNPNLMLRYKILEKLAVAGRVEYYHDPHNIIVPAARFDSGKTVMGFQTWSPSLNIDYYPAPDVALRLEGRLYAAQNAVFYRRPNADNPAGPITSHHDALVATSLAFRF